VISDPALNKTDECENAEIRTEDQNMFEVTRTFQLMSSVPARWKYIITKSVVITATIIAATMMIRAMDGVL
jgi:hypothetical protein